MKASDAFPSKWISAADLGDRDARVIMQRVEMEKIGDDSKPVLYFKGKQKGLVLNKTNAKTIADAYGDEMDDWGGGELILFTVWTEYQGKQVEAVRVRRPQPKDQAKRQTGGMSDTQLDRDTASAGGHAEFHDDPIPFAAEFR